jgi:phosphonatase-like hydrolase
MPLTRRQSLKAFAVASAASVAPQTSLAAAQKLRLIVFDVGGTIIQDHGDVPEALQGAFAKHGIKITPEEIAAVRGASKKEVVRRFATERSKAKGAELDKLIAAVYADFTANAIEAYKDVPPIAGAEAVFQSLRKSGLILTTSTGFGREISDSIFHRLNWEKYFAARITSDDVTQGRPAPYMIFHAMEAARITNVAEVLVIGDTPLDLQAGTNAGVRGVVGVISGASKREKLEPEPHTDIIASVADLPALIASRY